SVVKFLNTLILAAIRDHASEIGLDVEALGANVQFRKEGKLIDYPPPTREVGLLVCDRIRLMADMDLADKVARQSSRIELNVGGEPFQLDVATKPADGNEHIVIGVASLIPKTVNFAPHALKEKIIYEHLVRTE